MRKLSLNINAHEKPIFLQIARAISSAIKTGQVKANESLPSARSLAGQLQINRHTIMAAYQELIAQGWVESVERQGYRAVKNFPIEHSRALIGQQMVGVSPFAWQLNPLPFELANEKAAQDYRYNFAGGNPDIAAFPFNEFKSFMSACLARPELNGLSYGHNNGNQRFIEQVTTYLRRVRSITNKEIIAVNGSQEALYLIARVLLKPGAKVAVESLGYRPAWNAFKSTGAELIAIKQHPAGIDIDHLTLMIKTQAVSLIYLTPLHQYPTTVTLPIHERLQLYRLAASHQVAIIEDDYDHEFHYSSQPLAPLAADDPAGLVIYVSTFSKIMFPGCRIGFIAADSVLAKAIINYRSVINHKPNVLMQDAIGRWMQDGAFERHLRKTTRLYQQRRDHVVEALQKYQRAGLALDFIIPPGGMALWVDVKANASELEHYCKSNDVYLLSERHFHLHTSNDKNCHIRLGFAGMTEQDTSAGLAIAMKFFSR